MLTPRTDITLTFFNKFNRVQKLENISNIRSSNPTTNQCAKFDQRKNKDTKPALRV